MPAIVHTVVETSLLSVLQGSLNGDTSILVPSRESFYDTQAGASDAANFRYDGFVTKRGTLSEGCPGNGLIITLSSAADAAQFRVGDTCFLVGNAYVGAVNANNNEADEVIIRVVNPSNQTVIVTAVSRAGGNYAPGSSLIMVSASAPGAVVNSASAGASVGNEKLAALLTAFENHCSSNLIELGGGSTFTTFNANNVNGWNELPAVVGATLTMLTCPLTPANVGVSATVVGAAAGSPSVITLTDFRDANGDSIAQWPVAPVIGDTARLQLDLSEGKLASLGVAGGDMSTMVTALLTMHRKLDSTLAAPEIPLVNEWNVWGQMTGAMLRMTMPAGRIAGNAYTDAADRSITVKMDPAVGDIPFPLNGTLRVIDADDGVNSAAWGSPATQLPAPVGGARTYVPYTREQKSNVLDLGGVAVLGANIPNEGRLVELDGGVNGFAKTSGVAPEVNSNYLSGLLWQLTRAVIAYAVLSA